MCFKFLFFLENWKKANVEKYYPANFVIDSLLNFKETTQGASKILHYIKVSSSVNQGSIYDNEIVSNTVISRTEFVGKVSYGVPVAFSPRDFFGLSISTWKKGKTRKRAYYHNTLPRSEYEIFNLIR